MPFVFFISVSSHGEQNNCDKWLVYFYHDTV